MRRVFHERLLHAVGDRLLGFEVGCTKELLVKSIYRLIVVSESDGCASPGEHEAKCGISGGS